MYLQTLNHLPSNGHHVVWVDRYKLKLYYATHHYMSTQSFSSLLCLRQTWATLVTAQDLIWYNSHIIKFWSYKTGWFSRLTVVHSVGTFNPHFSQYDAPSELQKKEYKQSVPIVNNWHGLFLDQSCRFLLKVINKRKYNVGRHTVDITLKTSLIPRPYNMTWK